MSEPSDPPKENDGERAPRTVLEAIMFTDIEGSVRLAQRLGLERYAVILKRHGALFHEALRTVKTGHLEMHTGDGYMARFGRPSDAVAVALRFQWSIMREAWGDDCELRVRIGIHQGEILLISSEHEGPASVGTPQNLASRVMAMAAGGQVLLTRAVFDDARQFIRTIPEIPAEAQAELGWEAHGSYLIKGLDSPVEIFEVGERGHALFQKPENGPHATRSVSAEEEATLGWRPAKEMEVPKRHGWFLRERLGEGGFGEVWLAENRKTGEQRVFKFCFDAVRLRTFKRELVLFRLICDSLGKRRDIATLYEAQLESAPFFLESEYCPGGTLKQWLDEKIRADAAPMPLRLAIVARVARALAAAHSVGIIHKDVKPSNIFMEMREDGTPSPRLADFGIGVLQDPSALPALDLTFTGNLGDTGELTRTGTRLYSAPEYMVGSSASVHGDIYSLGVLLYQVAIGDFARPLSDGWQRDVPDDLVREDIAACVDGDPERRLSDARLLAERLENYAQRRAGRDAARRKAEHRRRMKVAVVCGAIAAVVFGAVSVIAMLLNRADTTSKTHTAEMSTEHELAAHRLYVSDLQAAAGDLGAGRAEVARAALNRHRPKTGERDRRGWEWFFADSLLNTGLTRTVSARPLRALAVSPDALRAAVAGDAGEVTIWSCDALEKIAGWSAGPHAVRCLGWSATGVLAGGLANGEVVLWEPDTGREIKRWWANDGGVNTLEWLPDSDSLFTGGANGSLARWSTDGRAIWQARREAPVQALAWRQESGSLGVVFGQPARLVVAEEARIADWHDYELHTPESALAWRPGIYEVAVGMKSEPLLSWNPYACKQSFSLDHRFCPRASAYGWSPRGDAVAVGCIDGTISVVDAYRGGDARIPLPGHKGRVTGLRWLDGKMERLLSAGEDGTLRAWDDLRRSSDAGDLRFPTAIADAQWHPSENKLAVLLAGDEVQIVDGASWKVEWSRPLPLPQNARAAFAGGRIAWSPDGRWLAAACAGRAPVAWHVADGEKFVAADVESGGDVGWLADSRRLLVRGPRGWSSVAVENAAGTPIAGTEKAVWIGGLDGGRLGMVLAKDDAPHFLTTNPNGGDPRLDTALPADLGPVRRCALNRDRTLLALAGESGAVMWIDTRTGQTSRPGTAHAGPALVLGWQPDGSRLASIGADGVCRIFNVAMAAQNWMLEPKLKPEVPAAGWSADGRRLMIASASERRVKIYDAGGSPSRIAFPERLAQACTAIERAPGEDFGWHALAQAVGETRGDGANPEADALLGAARLGIEARFCALGETNLAPAKIAAEWKGVPLPAAVRLAAACALGQWDDALALSLHDSSAAFFLLARAEALARLGRREDAEAATLEAWRALRRQHGGDEKIPANFSSSGGEGVDLAPWANIKLTEDWAGGQNNNLASLPAVLEPPGGRFHCRDFIQLAGKSLRIAGGRMLPRSTGWMPLNRAGSEVSMLVAACYVDVTEHLQDHCIGSLFLLRQGGGAVRIPLIYGRNVWDWWTPSSGFIDEAPEENVAWRGSNPNANSTGHNLALYRIAWNAADGEAPATAISIATHVRRPAPMLMSVDVK